ncbi:DUF2301 domain-containing membrane protein [Gynuella sunshinyii]|uniref:Putative integral membrane protein n=1 Tax=Gynuella sunshinyii YC6258 TaxID=1445510 RepID=A0A0C5VFR7_9GAMM|nr:DUF2301 domain-containing membrane protein [Gynuella sunshinyii]AJQ93427.1 putative integral membrane protein [Gynuella sunshinyii YC6258]
MADPHIKEKLDHWDITTVILYRSGLSLAPLALLLAVISADYTVLSHWLLMAAVTLCCFSLHIYDKNIRLIVQGCGWLALLLTLASAYGSTKVFELLGAGAAYLVLGALCFKESFCFKIPFLRLMPAVFAVDWLMRVSGWSDGYRLLLLVTAIALIILAIAKWRMPLHFDIGDKRNYQL